MLCDLIFILFGYRTLCTENPRAVSSNSRRVKQQRVTVSVTYEPFPMKLMKICRPSHTPSDEEYMRRAIPWTLGARCPQMDDNPQPSRVGRGASINTASDGIWVIQHE